MADQSSDAQVAEGEISKLLEAIAAQDCLARIRDYDVKSMMLRTQLVAVQNFVAIRMSLGKVTERQACDRVRELIGLPPSE